jgi:hypothetical protein
MSPQANVNERKAGTAQLHAALEPLLSRHFGARRILRLERRASEYSSSFALEELDVSLDDGTSLSLIFKDLGWQALTDSARGVKPDCLYNPLREIETYQTVLARSRLGTATCYGAVVDPPAGQYWLFLERVPGLRLCHVGEFATWQQVASHLAVLHDWCGREAGRMGPAQRAHFLRYDRDFYWAWLRRAEEFVGRVRSSVPGGGRGDFERLAGRYGRVVERLAALPATFIHGEFYPSNVLIDETGGGVRVCPVDWEMAALGPAPMDLAALTSGNWTDGQKTALALAYHKTLSPGGRSRAPLDDLLVALEYCRLHLAVQLLGWSPEWSPPPEYARNWLGEALGLADKLGLLS